MTDAEYFASTGLSYSGMKDLAVSPLRYWHLHVNPNRPKDEPTPEMIFGSALHCAALQPDQFPLRYACRVAAEDFEGCLVTVEDMRGWLRDKGHSPKGTRKAEIVAQVQAIDPNWPILEVIEARAAEQNAGKEVLKKEDWERVHRAVASLRDEPRVQELLSAGDPEVPFFATDEDTGVPLKAKMDWVTKKFTVDLKTFTQKRSKSIDKSIADAIFYEEYYLQGTLYSKLRGWPTWSGEFILVFVESEEPHEVRIRSLRPRFGGNPTLYWTRALMEIRNHCHTYAECMKHFGVERPWRWAQEVNALCDEELPGLAFN